MNTLELNDVTKTYGDFIAVDNLNLEIEKGKVVSILGPSGCGKTTTLRMIAGFVTPGRGAIKIDGKDVVNLRPYERNVGILFQDYALFPHMTVAQNVGYGLKYRGKNPKEIPSRVDQMLSLVQMTKMASRYPHELSGGQQQRVGLARALATDPQIVLLDEPLSALDAKLRLELRIELKEILKSVGATTIVVTHDQEEALSLGDEVIVMRAGRIAQRGSPSEIYGKPADRFVAEFVGRSNWFQEAVRASSNEGAAIYMIGQDLEVRVKPGSNRPTCDLCVRPENIEFFNGSPLAAGASADLNVIPAVVMDVAPLGADVHVVVEVAGRHRLLVVQKNSGAASNLSPGQQVQIAFAATNIQAF